jgi:predicted nucleotidyltransferase component of viral defense system
MAEPSSLRLHHEDPILFREAVRFTATQTGFVPRLIEKDYFCTVVLEFLAASTATLVFRGGTCLAKVHTEFYRLSEDLDFAIPTPLDASRSDRSLLAVESKRAIGTIGRQVAGLRIVTALTGANESSQYAAVLGYASLLGGRDETIKIEIGLREPLLQPATPGEARTLLLDPIANAPLVPGLPIPCLSRAEAMAEKLRAALSRREAAVRDFYDVDHAVRRLGFRLNDPEFLALVRTKLAVPGNDPVDVSPARMAALNPQVDAQLKPVLRDRDFAEFDLARAFSAVAAVAAAVSAPTATEGHGPPTANARLRTKPRPR